jgi:nicotinamide-nucleotide amidase
MADRPPASRAVIVAVGDELLRGETVDTNGAYLGAELTLLGIDVAERRVVPDDVDAIAAAVRIALEQSDLVVVTGGLGPTVDDRTEAAIRQVVGGLEVREVPNPVGTAPGLLARPGGRFVLALPGPPRELRAVWANALPSLGLVGSAAQVVTLTVAGIRESVIAKRLAPLGRLQVAVAYYAGPGQVRVRLSGDAVFAAADLVRELLGDAVFEHPNGLAGAALDAAGAAEISLAVAESLTGGALASSLTDVAGASDVLVGGVVAYRETVKRQVLGVDPELLRTGGTVHPEVAVQMAHGVARLAGADLGVATTGVAGPSPHSGHPPGTVFVAWALRGDAQVRGFEFGGDRDWVRSLTVAAALDGIRRLASGLPLGEQDEQA